MVNPWGGRPYTCSRGGEDLGSRLAGSARRMGVWRLGLIGLVLMSAGSGSYVAMVMPAYRYSDEQVHMGYVEFLALGRLPTIYSEIPLDRGNEDLDRQVRSERRQSRREIYTGHNPPHSYALAVLPVRLAVSLDTPGGGLLILRMMSVLGYSAAMVLVAHLARDLAGGSERIGLIAGALMAGMTGLVIQMAVAGLDALALVATVGVTWGALRFVRDPSGRMAWQLGGWLALASAVRSMTLVFAGVAVALAISVTLVRSIRRCSVRPVLSHAPRVVLPTILVSGWWLLRNFGLYRSPTASAALIEKHGREAPGPSTWELLAEPTWMWRTWSHLFRGLESRPPMFPHPIDERFAHGALLVVALAVVLVCSSWWRSREHQDRERVLNPIEWGLVLALSTVPFVLVAIHRSGGGGAHGRYFMPAVPFLACSAALLIGWSRFRPWAWLMVAAVGGFLLWQVGRLRSVPERVLNLRGEWVGPPLVGQAGRFLGLGVAAVGIALTVLALCWSTRAIRVAARSS